MDGMWRMDCLLAAFAVSAFLTGAGIYEQLVLDLAWPAKPSIVIPREGGANRKLFWVPGNILMILAVLMALVAAWPMPAARYATLIGVVLFGVINVITVAYFGREVLRVERHGEAPDAPASLAWVRRSRWRTPLSVGVNVALAVAILFWIEHAIK